MNTIKKVLINYSGENTDISHEELIAAQAELRKYAKNKDFFRIDQYKINIGVQISRNYANLNQRRSFYSECVFVNSNFTNTGLTGSIFSNCNFMNNILKRTIFDSCNFRQCNFVRSPEGNNVLECTNFNNAVFVECIFDGIVFDASMASNALFENVKFKNCVFLGMLWEAATFKNVNFDNCQMKGLNFEQCFFENIHMYNIRLLFPTIPFIINGIKYLMETEDDVYISSANSSNGLMNKEEYLKLLPTLEKFYYGTKNYFPLANIYVAQEKYQEAYNAIINGLKLAIQLRAFKSLRSFCLLLKTITVLEPKHYNFAYECIQNEIGYQFFSSIDYYILSRYLGEVRQLLVSGRNDTVIGITIKTGINEDEYDKLGILISILNMIIDYSNTKANNYIEIRHFSPYDIFCHVTANPECIFSIIGIIYSGLLGIETIYNKYKEHTQKLIAEKQALAQTELIKAQTEQIKIDNLLKKQQLEKKIEEDKHKIEHTQQIIHANKIIINNISHNIIDGSILNCEPIFQSYFSSNTNGMSSE